MRDRVRRGLARDRTPRRARHDPLSAAEAGDVVVRAWGHGADWALEHAPALVGADDDDEGFRPLHPVLTRPAPPAPRPAHLPIAGRGRGPRPDDHRAEGDRHRGQALLRQARPSLRLPRPRPRRPPAPAVAGPAGAARRRGPSTRSASSASEPTPSAGPARTPAGWRRRSTIRQRRRLPPPHRPPGPRGRGRRPRWPSSPWATPTPSAWATSTCPTTSRSPSPASPAATTTDARAARALPRPPRPRDPPHRAGHPAPPRYGPRLPFQHIAASDAITRSLKVWYRIAIPNLRR